MRLRHQPVVWESRLVSRCSGRCPVSGTWIDYHILAGKYLSYNRNEFVRSQDLQAIEVPAVFVFPRDVSLDLFSPWHNHLPISGVNVVCVSYQKCTR